LADTKNDMNLLEKSQYKIAEFLVENNKPIIFNYEGKYSLTSSDYEAKESVKETPIETQKPKSTYKPYTKNTNYTKAETEKPNYTSYNKEAAEPVEAIKPAQSTDLYDSLKKYRLDTSRKEGIKPYFVFNNKQLDELVAVKPKTTKELLGISGFGEKTVEKYGQDIIRIISGK
jgi:superfamily II DNA helicase RecQ